MEGVDSEPLTEALNLGGGPPPEVLDDFCVGGATIADAEGKTSVGVPLRAGQLEEEARGHDGG